MRFINIVRAIYELEHRHIHTKRLLIHRLHFLRLGRRNSESRTKERVASRMEYWWANEIFVNYSWFSWTIFVNIYIYIKYWWKSSWIQKLVDFSVKEMKSREINKKKKKINVCFKVIILTLKNYNYLLR